MDMCLYRVFTHPSVVPQVAVTVAMAQPTQDTDISSSFTLLKPLENNELSSSIYNKQLPMEGGTETSAVSPTSDCDIVGESCQNRQHRNSSLNKNDSIEGAFPWHVKFTQIMCSSVGSKSYELLERLLLVYTQNVSSNTETYCLKANEAIKLKNHVSNTLTFFHLYWHDIKKQINDDGPYLNKMSVLLGIYVDMELKASSRTTDPYKLAAKLLNALRIYLHNSEEHIFRVLLRIKLITKRYTKICDPIFMKSFSNLRKNVGCLTDMAYVKFLLALKLWRRIKEDPRDKKKIYKVALTILGPHMPQMRDGLLKFIPRPPAGHENETLWLLQPNLFDLRQAREHYLLLEDETNNAIDANSLSSEYQIIPLFDEHDLQQEHTLSTQIFNDCLNNPKNDNATKYTTSRAKIVNNNNSLKKRGRFRKGRSIPKMKSGKVILVDLTEDNEPTTYLESRKKQRKSKTKLEWLKVITKKYKGQKQTNATKCANGVEIANAHSTKNSENSIDEVPVQYMPISDNKVSESTESCCLINVDKSMRDAQCIDSKNIENENQDLWNIVQPNKLHDFCTSSLKHDETQHNRIHRILKLLKLVGQNVKDPKVELNLMQSSEGKELPQGCCMKGNKVHNASDHDTPNKGILSSAEDYFTDTSILPEMCQNCTITSEYVKQELPTSTGCSVMEGSPNYSQSTSSDSSVVNQCLNKTEIDEAIKQELLHGQQECADCCKKIDAKPCIYSTTVDSNVKKPKDSVRHIACDTVGVVDKKTATDKNRINMLSDLDKCVDVSNRIREHIMSVHVEKQRMDCLNRRTDMCTVSTTVFGDEITQSSLDYWTRDLNSLTADKINKILELYRKKDFLNVCKTKEPYEQSTQKSIATKMYIDHDLERHKPQITSPTSKADGSCLQGNDTGQSAQVLTYIRTNDDSAGIGEYENGVKNLSSSAEQLQKSNIYGSQNTEHSESMEPICNPRFQNMSCAAGEDDVVKTDCINDFENVDILDSILNGDMNFEDDRDIMEDVQSSLMSAISDDNSSSDISYITEFFTKSKNPHVIKKQEKLYKTPDSEVPTKPLPKSSFETTGGIFNSLLDFDITTMDSPLNDFIYSNIQVINPPLIKQASTKDISSTAKSTDMLEVLFHKRTHSPEVNNVMDVVPTKQDESCTNDSVVNSSVDIVGIGLNRDDEKTFELFGLEDEEPGTLIQNLPAAFQPPLLMHSDVMTSYLRETLPKSTFVSPIHELTTDTVIEHSYIYEKEDAVKEFESPSDFISCSSSEMCDSNDIHTPLATSCLATQSGCDLSCSFNYVSVFPTNFTSPTIGSTDNSLTADDLISSADLMSPCTDISTIPQSSLDAYESVLTQLPLESTHTLELCEKSPRTQSNKKQLQSAKFRTATRVSEREKPSKRKSKGDKVSEKHDTQADLSNHDTQCVRQSQLTQNPPNHHTAQSVTETPTSSPPVSCRQKSPIKTYSAEEAFKGFSFEDSRQKKHILINFHGKALKDLEASDEIPIKPKTRWSMQCVKTQPSRFLKKQAVMKQAVMRQASNLSPIEETPPMKRRKISSKILPLSRTDRVIYSMNQKETRGNHLISLKKDLACIDGSKHSVGK